jgi:exopolyphosphatase/guanosine-5'-triphosphate,3'-diphosphate pyrophosphatase
MARPSRWAAIDLGTNSVLLTIAEFDGFTLAPLLERATITRLGQGVDRTRRLDQAARARTLACLVDYAEDVENYGVSELVVVGTSALRDADGAAAFLAEATRVLGVRPQIISGDEEARLTFEGALSGLEIAGRVAVVDIGGGSTEFTIGERAATAELEFAESVDIGSVRLFERHIRSDPPRRGELDALRHDARSAIEQVRKPKAPVQLVGVAGTVTTLAAIKLGLDAYDPRRVHGSRLSAEDILELSAKLSALTLVGRRKLRGLEPARADVIVAGALLLGEALRWAGADELTVSDRGVRWGVLWRQVTTPDRSA